MNYYERHLGDYAKNAGHLSLLEHGAYTLLLDRYYTTEAPIPGDQVYRLTRARSNEEQQAVDAVLMEFFTQEVDGWRHSRCDAELAKYLEKQAGKAEEREHETERKRRYRARRTELFSQLREAGTVPAFNVSTTELERLLSHGTEPGQDGDSTANQTPVTSHQSPPRARASAPASGSRLHKDWSLPDDWRAWAQAERPEVDVEDEAEKFRDYWRGKAGKDARKADWQATWRNWIRNARAIAIRENTAPNQTGGRHATTRPLSAVDRIAANVHRAQQHYAEQHDDFVEGKAVRLSR